MQYCCSRELYSSRERGVFTNAMAVMVRVVGADDRLPHRRRRRRTQTHRHTNSDMLVQNEDRLTAGLPAFSFTVCELVSAAI
jgi:hypothetical protein